MPSGNEGVCTHDGRSHCGCCLWLHGGAGRQLIVRLIGRRVLMHEEEFGVMCGQRCDKFQKNIVASVTDTDKCCKL